MSGGHFGYKNDYLCQEIFNYGAFPDYGLNSRSVIEERKKARLINPCEDKIISELVFDMFCLMHSLDWYLSGDTGPDTYQADVKIFKEKWLKALTKNKEFLKERVDRDIVNLKEEIYKTYGLSD